MASIFQISLSPGLRKCALFGAHLDCATTLGVLPLPFRRGEGWGEGSVCSLLRVPLRCAPLCALLLALHAQCLRAEDADWLYTVQISAMVQVSPPQIMLNWEPDEYGVNSYTVFRKSKEAASWGEPIATLLGSALGFTDTSVVAGTAYEYQIIKYAMLGNTGYGYIFAGINAPLTESRGKLLLIVATNATASLANELARLQTDL